MTHGRIVGDAVNGGGVHPELKTAHTGRHGL